MKGEVKGYLENNVILIILINHNLEFFEIWENFWNLGIFLDINISKEFTTFDLATENGPHLYLDEKSLFLTFLLLCAAL